MALSEVAAAGDALASLRGLRDRLAAEIDVCDSQRDIAALAARFMDVLERIAVAEKLQPAGKGTPLDELRERRALAAGASAAKGAARGRK